MRPHPLIIEDLPHPKGDGSTPSYPRPCLGGDIFFSSLRRWGVRLGLLPLASRPNKTKKKWTREWEWERFYFHELARSIFRRDSYCEPTHPFMQATYHVFFNSTLGETMNCQPFHFSHWNRSHGTATILPWPTTQPNQNFYFYFQKQSTTPIFLPCS